MLRLTALILLLSSPAWAIDGLPVFKKDAPYASVRKTLIAKGWEPVTTADAQPCGDDPRCKGLPEVEACAGTGLANCLFTWRRGKSLIGITTIGERPVFDGVQCREGCK